MNIVINSDSSGVQECSISYSREGYIPVIYTVGDNTKIETTLFLNNSNFTDSLTLEAGWVGDATETEKKEDPTKTDVYSRFSTDPTDSIYDELDNAGDGSPSQLRGVSGPKMYRGFSNSTFNYDTANEAISGSAMIETSTDTWEFSGGIGLGARTQDGAVPYLRIQAGDKALEVANKDKNKAVTCIVEGGSHVWTVVYEDADVLNQWFYPILVTNTDRFKRYKVYKSYRKNPSNTITPDADPRDDLAECGAYGEKLLEGTTTPSISGTITSLGRAQNSIGTVIKYIENDQYATYVNLAIVDEEVFYSPPKQAGDSGSDMVTIQLGGK